MRIAASIAGAAVAVALALPTSAVADWPERPVRLIVPFGVGGGADTLGRGVADILGRTLGQQVVVENVTGAGGVVGATALANSDPDGYTFGVINVSTQVIAPVTNPNVTYDPIEDFEYVALLGGAPTVISVNTASGIMTIEELNEAARASATPFTYGTAGTLTLSNLVPAVYFSVNDVPVEHLPYQGGVAALTDAVAGHISFVSGTLSSVSAQIDEGVMRGLVISTSQRVPAYPDMPTMAELGHPELTSLTWFGVAAPAGTDPEIVARMNAEINAALEDPALRDRLEADGFVVELLTPEEFLQYQISQAATFGPIARDIGN
jgi:tripartite-type tricarboxylate transporter receptor subunit TctC